MLKDELEGHLAKLKAAVQDVVQDDHRIKLVGFLTDHLATMAAYEASMAMAAEAVAEAAEDAVEAQERQPITIFHSAAGRNGFL